MSRRRAVLAGLLAVTAFGVPGDARAQDDWWWSGAWSIATASSLPVSSGSRADFLTGASFRGLAIEGHRLPRTDGRWSVGFSVGWQEWNAEAVAPAPIGATQVSGWQLRYQNVFPVLGIGRLYAHGPGEMRPWIGVGVGGYAIERRVVSGQITVDDNRWHFGLAPEAGLLLPIGDGPWAAVASVSYQWALSAGGSGEQRWLSLSMGAAYR